MIKGGTGGEQFYKGSFVPSFFQTMSLFMGLREGIHFEFMDVHRCVCPEFCPSQVLWKIYLFCKGTLKGSRGMEKILCMHVCVNVCGGWGRERESMCKRKSVYVGEGREWGIKLTQGNLICI